MRVSTSPPHFRLVCLTMFMMQAALRPVLLAQDKEEVIRISFTCLSIGTFHHELYCFIDGSLLPLTIPSAFRSNPVQYEGPNPIPIYKMEPGEDGSPRPVKVASVRVPDGMKEGILVFSAPKAEAALQVDLFADDDENFPPGTYRVSNWTGTEAAVEIGGLLHVIPHGKTRDILVEDHESGPIAVSFSYRGDDRSRSLVQTRMFHDPRSRVLLFLYDEDPHRPRIQVRAITQRRPEAPVKTDGADETTR